MSWFTGIFASAGGKILSGVGKLLDEVHVSGEEKQAFAIRMEELVQAELQVTEATLRQVLDAQTRIVLAELAQEDKYTKRMRPTIGYAGLVLMLAMVALKTFKGIDLVVPAEFWYAWMGVTGTYALGRSLEKSGERGKLVEYVTGKKDKKVSLLE